MVGAPIGTEEYVRGRAMEVVRDGGAGHVARCLANMPDKQAAALITVESSRATDELPRKDSGLGAVPRSM